MDKDDLFMNLALDEAKQAEKNFETPIGAIVIYDDKVIGRGYNRRNQEKNPLAHAELIAIKEASSYIGDWRLENCEMYVTVEPCPMCAGAIVQSRMKRVVYGCRNLKAGSCGSIVNLMDVSEFNHQVQVVGGIMEEECSKLMRRFFKSLRDSQK